MFHLEFIHFILRGSQSNIGFTNEKMIIVQGTVTVITSVKWISSKKQDEGVTRVRVGAVITSAAYSRGEVGDISAIMGLGPDSSPIIIIAISPVPSLGLLLDTVPHKTVVLQQALDLHQPAPHQLILSPGVQPAELHFGEEVLVTNLDMIIGAFYVDAFLFA